MMLLNEMYQQTHHHPPLYRQQRRTIAAGGMCMCVRARERTRTIPLHVFLLWRTTQVESQSVCIHRATHPPPVCLSVWLLVLVLGFVVHYQPVLHEIETVAFGLVWVCDDVVPEGLRQLRQLIHGLPLVDGVRDAERQREVERLEQSVAKIVTLHQLEISDRLAPHSEMQSGADVPFAEEVCRELVSDAADGLSRSVGLRGRAARLLSRRLCDGEYLLVRVAVPNLEGDELYVVHIGSDRTEEVLCRAIECTHVRWRDLRVVRVYL
mmetsp:Transcript_32784/g.81200  ORF Transcript_32784/g.81200 Transcript_32784/m.81200 type:complete len:266 (-) Transcript_32784:158-955(-)